MQRTYTDFENNLRGNDEKQRKIFDIEEKFHSVYLEIPVP